jgi:hypothetical protein
MEDISQAPQESKEPSKGNSTNPSYFLLFGFLFDDQLTQYTEIAKKEKVGSTKEKQRRGKVLKPIKGNSTNPSFCCS